MQIGPKSNSIGAYGLRNAVRTVNNLRNIDFDSNFSYAYDGSGVHISANHKSISPSDEFRHHFKVESNTASNTASFLVRGGYWLREQEDGTTLWKTPLSCDTGAYSGDYDKQYKTISLATNTADNYISIVLDDALRPTSCDVLVSTTWPVFNDLTSYEVIATINGASNVINQFITEDKNDNTYARMDSHPHDGAIETCTLEINGITSKTQLYKFPDRIDTKMVTGDLVVFSDQNGGTGGAPSVSYTSSVLHADTAEDANNSSHSDSSDWAGYANNGSWPTTFDHPSLTDRDLSDLGGHRYYWAYSGWRHPDTQSYATDADVTAGRFLIYGGPQYWNNVALNVDVTSTIDLYADDDISIDSAADIMESSLNYFNCTSGTILIQAYTNNTIESTTGWVTIDGDVGVSILSANSVSISATDDVIVDAGNVVDIYGTNSLTISAQGGRAIVLDADIDLQTGGELQINSAKGKTGWVDDGVNFRLTFTKGLITTVANTSGAGWSSD